MAHKKALEALHRTLRDIRGNDRLMGGVMFLSSGNFRQTLPIIPKGTLADELNTCLKASPLRCQRHHLQLHENMRVTLMGNEQNAKRFSETLLKVGEGKIPLDSNRVLGIPEGFGTVMSKYESLLNKVYHDFVQKCKDPNYLSERTIVAPLNDVVDKVNDRILASLPGAQRQYLSVDEPVLDSQVVEFPAEFLHSQQPSSVPSHVINLKVSAPIMLLRNMEAPRICNRTRLIVKDLIPNVIRATMMTNCSKGEDAFILSIPIIPSNFPIEFKRMQFTFQ